MCLAYLITWLVTLLSSWIAIVVGIFTSGYGALAVLYLTDKYIIPIDYDTSKIRIFGGIAFLISIFFSYFLPEIHFEKWDSKYDSDKFDIQFAFFQVIFFWQIIVGCILLLYIDKEIENKKVVQ